MLLPGLLATEAGGQNRFELDAPTVGDALRALPVRDRLFDERGELRRHINVYVNGEPSSPAAAVGDDDRVDVLPAISGGR